MIEFMVCSLNDFKNFFQKRNNKSSAVAEIGDHARRKWAEKWGAAVSLSVGGAGSPSNSVTWAEAYLRTKWHLGLSNCLATTDQCYRHTDRQTDKKTVV